MSKVKNFGKHVVMSIASGRLLCDFGDMHEAIEFLAQEPVFTHQLASSKFADWLSEAVYAQYPDLRELSKSIIDNLDANPKALREASQALSKELAKTVMPLQPAANFEAKAKLMRDSFMEPLQRIGSAK
jgi:hypothetical protein